MPEGEGARHAPATARNRDPLVDALRPLLPRRGLVLEVASGTGEHAVHFARRFPDLEWQPTDADPAALASIAAWAEARPAPHLRPPLLLDVRERWPVERADAVLAINLLHIAPWAATEALVAGAGRVLPGGGPLIVYGPFWREGVEPAPSQSRLRRKPADARRRVGRALAPGGDGRGGAGRAAARGRDGDAGQQPAGGVAADLILPGTGRGTAKRWRGLVPNPSVTPAACQLPVPGRNQAPPSAPAPAPATRCTARTR